MELLAYNGGSQAFPVVVLTGQGDEHAAVEAMKAGALDYIVKTPDVFADLPHIAQRALKQWQDIIDRQRAQESLVASEKRFRSLLESAPDAIVISDAAGTIQVVSAQVEEMFGYLRGELIGKPVEVLIPAANRQRHVRDRQSFFAAPTHRSICRGREPQGWQHIPGGNQLEPDCHGRGAAGGCRYSRRHRTRGSRTETA
ncbi:MAG: PAS domain S-box protein [Planctomycetia bacterium]|nr:PAS domain S-box protein [Planctomycetia bacterium]